MFAVPVYRLMLQMLKVAGMEFVGNTSCDVVVPDTEQMTADAPLPVAQLPAGRGDPWPTAWRPFPDTSIHLSSVLFHEVGV